MQHREFDLENGEIDIEKLLQLSPEELLELRYEERPHPDVRFDRRNLELVVHYGRSSYEIDLERCNDPAQILNWIYQLNGKSWMTHVLMGQVIRALDNACHEVFDEGVQGVFCSGGVSRQANWKSKADKRLINGSKRVYREP